MHQKVVIVGAGHAGGAAAMALRDLGFSGLIKLIGEESEPPYERPSLSKEFLSGAESAPVYLADETRWRELDVTLTLGVTAVEIDRQARQVRLSDGAIETYDHLILATGGRVRRLDTADHPRIHHLRTTGDARAIAADACPGVRAVVVGGGVIGLETASTLVELGLSVVVLEAGPRLLGRNIPVDGADWLSAAHARIGVEIRLGASVTSVEETGAGLSIRLSDGEILTADLMVVGIGIIPSSELAETAGLPTGGGVLVDADYRSHGDPRVFAIGDLAVRAFGDEVSPRRMETWAHAQTSARAAALAIMGQPREPEPTPWFWTAQCGHMLQIVGDPAAADNVIARSDHVRLYLRQGLLVGAACLDQTREFGAIRRMIGKALDAEAASNPATDLRKAVL